MAENQKEIEFNLSKVLDHLFWARTNGIYNGKISDFELEKEIREDVKEFIRLLKEEFEICRDKTDVWADEERWNKFEKMFKKRIKEIAGDKFI